MEFSLCANQNDKIINHNQLKMQKYLMHKQLKLLVTGNGSWPFQSGCAFSFVTTVACWGNYAGGHMGRSGMHCARHAGMAACGIQHRQLGADYSRGYRRHAAAGLICFAVSLLAGADDQGYRRWPVDLPCLEYRMRAKRLCKILIWNEWNWGVLRFVLPNRGQGIAYAFYRTFPHLIELFVEYP